MKKRVQRRFDCYIVGRDKPVTIEEYSAYILDRMEADKVSGRKSVDLPDVYIYDPAPGE